MIRTIAGLAVGMFILKRTSPKTYAQVLQAADDIVSTASNITTTMRGQAEAYCAEAAADASQRLQQVDPHAVEELRKLLG